MSYYEKGGWFPPETFKPGELVWVKSLNGLPSLGLIVVRPHFPRMESFEILVDEKILTIWNEDFDKLAQVFPI